MREGQKQQTWYVVLTPAQISVICYMSSFFSGAADRLPPFLCPRLVRRKAPCSRASIHPSTPFPQQGTPWTRQHQQLHLPKQHHKTPSVSHSSAWIPSPHPCKPQLLAAPYHSSPSLHLPCPPTPQPCFLLTARRQRCHCTAPLPLPFTLPHSLSHGLCQLLYRALNRLITQFRMHRQAAAGLLPS